MSMIKEDILKPQVERSHYFAPSYLTPGRMAAYSYQFSEIVRLKPKSILEIGIGNGLLSFMLRQSGFDVTTLDFDPALEPDIVASVTDIPCPINSFDVVSCFEVLEHLPFEQFQKSLEEIKRVTRRYTVLSLPDARRSARVRIPFLGRREFLIQEPFYRQREHKFNGEHYWEINTRGFRLKSIVTTIESSGFILDRTFRIWEFSAHRMFVLRKCSSSQCT